MLGYIAKSVTGKAGKNTTMNGVTVRWVRNALRFQWIAAPEYYRVLRELSPSIVVQRMTSFETGVAAHYCRQKRIPFIWVCTDNALSFRWFFLRNQWNISRKVCHRWLKRSVLMANAFFMDLSRHYGMAHTSLAFTQNEMQHDALLRSYGLESSMMVSGHEPPTSCIVTEVKLAGRIILWVANLGARKRPQLFIELARLNKESSWRFVMIGGKNDEAYVRELFRDKPVNLEWLGRLPFEETLFWFDKAAWFVNTSVAAWEGFPNTYIQAWMRGVPVLSLGSDPDGVISRHGLGFVCETIDKMSEIITRTCDEMAYDEISRKVRDYSVKNHSVQQMADRFLEQLSKNGISTDSSV